MSYRMVSHVPPNMRKLEMCDNTRIWICTAPVRSYRATRLSSASCNLISQIAINVSSSSSPVLFLNIPFILLDMCLSCNYPATRLRDKRLKYQYTHGRKSLQSPKSICKFHFFIPIFMSMSRSISFLHSSFHEWTERLLRYIQSTSKKAFMLSKMHDITWHTCMNSVQEEQNIIDSMHARQNTHTNRSSRCHGYRRLCRRQVPVHVCSKCEERLQTNIQRKEDFTHQLGHPWTHAQRQRRTAN